MDIKLKGMINWIDFKKNEIIFNCFNTNKKLKLNIFMGNKNLRWMSWKLKSELLKIVSKSKGIITVTGYCYNGETLIAEEIDFSEVEGFDQFVNIANETRQDRYDRRNN